MKLEAPGLTIPHIGWHTITFARASPLTEGLGEAATFYHVHSFVPEPEDADDVVGRGDYGGPFVSIVQRGNVMGAQFHPGEVLPRRARPAAQLREPPGRGLMILYPAIDIRGGKAVRLTHGRFDAETVYHDDPLEAARSWVDAGARFLHVVDLDGAEQGAPASLDHLRRIVAGTGVPVQYGGGLRTPAAVRDALRAGAERVIVGTAALARRRLPGRGRRRPRAADRRVGRRARRADHDGGLDGDLRPARRRRLRPPQRPRRVLVRLHGRRPRRGAGRAVARRRARGRHRRARPLPLRGRDRRPVAPARAPASCARSTSRA